MTGSELHKWALDQGLIQPRTGPGLELSLVAAVNREREAQGLEGISPKTLHNYLYSRAEKPIPEWLRLLLPAIEARLANPEAVHWVEARAGLDDEERRLLDSAIEASATSERQFLSICLQIGIEGEIEIYRSKKREKRKE